MERSPIGIPSKTNGKRGHSKITWTKMLEFGNVHKIVTLLIRKKKGMSEVRKSHVPEVFEYP